MSHTKNEREDGMLSKNRKELALIDDGNCGDADGGALLKKGPWTSAEDAILIDYVKKHGEGNWNAVQKHSGLFRCGKSCRLRWANHLRPNLKKGAFTREEEHLIIELHAKMGNKWARMAANVKSSPKVIKIQVLVNLYPSSSSIAYIRMHCKAKMESSEKTKIQYLVHALKDNELH